MFTPRTAHAALSMCFALACASCAAEHLEARDPARGPTSSQAPATPVVRPTDLRATETQLTPTAADAAPVEPHHPPAKAAPKTVPEGKPVYACPMHPEVRSAAPGACPQCGMKLQKLEPSP